MTIPPPHWPPPYETWDVRSLDAIPAQTRSLVFGAILSGEPISRTQIARIMHLSPSTVTRVVGPLLAAGYVIELDADRHGRRAGRPQRMLAVNHERHAAIGLKLHPKHVTGVHTDIGSRVVGRARRRHRGHRVERTLEAATAVVHELLDGRAPSAPPVLGLGVAVGGHVSTESGTLVHSGILGWDDVDLAAPLARATELPTVVYNDTDALAVAQRWFGKGRGVDSFAVVSLGAGIGCGLVLRRELYAGSSGLAGELGHLPLLPDSTPCSCGNRGCLEAIASDAAILRAIHERGGPTCRSIQQARRLAREDSTKAGKAARQAHEAAGDALGRGLATLCNLLNLQRIVLSGEGVVAFDLLGPSLEAALTAHGFSSAARDCELVVDAVDDDLWARGAACLVIHHALQRAEADDITRS